MKSKKSRLALMGVLALALSLTVGLVSGSVADAKKKKGKKGAKSFVVSSTAPTAVPPATPTAGGPSVVKVPIGTVAGGKKLKGKVISLNGVTVTESFSGDAGFANSTFAQIIGPSGRVSGLAGPFPGTSGPGASSETSSGPTTETPQSSTTVCVPGTTPPPPPCTDPDATLGPPYAGTIGNLGLLGQSGASPVGTWFVKVFNFSTSKSVTLNSISVTGNLINALPST
jgi:hypothetical protein